MTRELVLSVTPADCDLQTFTAGGKGGQNQNRSNTGVRWTHRESGAVGVSRDTRSQLQNKKLAWRRMCETKEFKTWVRMKLGQDAAIDAEVERMMWPVNIRTEVRSDNEWVVE